MLHAPDREDHFLDSVFQSKAKIQVLDMEPYMECKSL